MTCYCFVFESFFLAFFLVKYVPEWFLGAGFQRLGKQWKAQVMRFRNSPFEFTRNAMVNMISGTVKRRTHEMSLSAWWQSTSERGIENAGRLIRRECRGGRRRYEKCCWNGLYRSVVMRFVYNLLSLFLLLMKLIRWQRNSASQFPPLVIN